VSEEAVDVSNEEELESRRFNNFERFQKTNMAPEAERLIQEALLVQHRKTRGKYFKRNQESRAQNLALKEENLALKEENLALKQENLAFKEKIKQISESLICPITQDVIQDPVMLPDGHTYEHAAIRTWLEKNNSSPCNRACDLYVEDIRPQFTVRKVLEALALK
jgi:hypothetical protein